MDTDGYTPAVSLDELMRLARQYAPEGLHEIGAPGAESPGQIAERTVCPCIRGEPCVVAAVAEEFERLAELFHREQARLNPGTPPADLKQVAQSDRLPPSGEKK